METSVKLLEQEVEIVYRKKLICNNDIKNQTRI